MALLPQWSMVILPFASLISCGKGSVSGTKVIVGQAELSPIGEHPLGERMKELVGAVGMTNYKCTAFHLGEGLVATAGHCFPKAKKPSKRRPCLETTITWGITQEGSSGVKSRCVEILDQEFTEDLDFALIQVDPYPKDTIKINYAPDLEASHWVLGHPDGKPMHLSASCTLTEKGEHQVYHTCDTLPGNSGSPIINDDLEVVAIHNGGRNEQNHGSLLAETTLPRHAIRRAEGQAAPSSLSFGPMDNNQKELLVSLTTDMAELVSLNIEMDIEDQYDVIKYVDGEGHLKTITGQKVIELKDVQTPVLVSFVSDYAGPSNSIKVNDIEMY